METIHDINEILNALDMAIARVPNEWSDLSQDENVMRSVMELEYDLKPLSIHLGVSKSLFPKVEELENDELKLLVSKMLDAWAAYNYFADLPDGLPIRIAYKILFDVWDDEVPCIPEGEFHFDFHEMDLEQYVNPSNRKT